MTTQGTQHAISIVPTITRQTPKADFGDHLSATLNGALSGAGGLVREAFGMQPILSAAVSAVAQVTAGNGSATSGAVTSTVSNGYLTTGAPLSVSQDRVSQVARGAEQYNDPSVREMHTASMEYLALQNQTQQESREYNAKSNLLKVRHDSAKSAIGNIR